MSELYILILFASLILINELVNRYMPMRKSTKIILVIIVGIAVILWLLYSMNAIPTFKPRSKLYSGKIY